jgi:hypothetical protein
MKRIILSVLLSLLLSQRLVFAQDSQVIRLGQAMTTAGDMIINNTRAQPARLPIGSAGQVLTVGATGIPSWSSSSIVLTDPTISGNLTFSSATARIIPGATSLTFRNNADSASNLSITDAGTVTVERGALLLATPSNAFIARSVAGPLWIQGENVTASGHIILQPRGASGRILVYNASSLNLWSFTQGGNFEQDATNGQNIVLTKASTAVAQSVADGLTAAGTTVTDALQLTAVHNRVTTTASGTGVKAFNISGVSGYHVYITNRGANALLVYPPDADDQINSLGDGAGFSVAAGTSAVCWKLVDAVAARWGCR